jgi:mono/diheme cytochrome c family protein
MRIGLLIQIRIVNRSRLHREQPTPDSFFILISERRVMIRLFSFIVGQCLLTFILGCGKTDPAATEGPPSPMVGPSTGNAVFDTNCANCHSTTAPAGGGPKRKGPNLSKVGDKHDAKWLADHVRDPKSHKPGSMMPEFGTKLSDDDIKSVSEFMAGLK